MACTPRMDLISQCLMGVYPQACILWACTSWGRILHRRMYPGAPRRAPPPLSPPNTAHLPSAQRPNIHDISGSPRPARILLTSFPPLSSPRGTSSSPRPPALTLHHTTPIPRRRRLSRFDLPCLPRSLARRAMKPPRRAPATAKTAQDRAALDVELSEHGARVLAQARGSHPKNTNKTYNPKQKEWQVSGARGRPVWRVRFHTLTGRL
jgi:hypothetical protein